ncbi:hypothetical protein [Croceivirga thetidis]|uniref:DUF4132 domain-containing protein n=1 Tax=Croceivirga thetidis TaxID=2721623 RepID=A0ABX1GL63_9FLAO|nr:hypothetical protein [Croceivirga thetidis]NKI30374.1 hypothetical protein [Croceivirga thetidis]
MSNQIHFITQYLAMAGKRFLEPKPDDSHTNLCFNSENKSFETWSLNQNGLKLQFDLPDFRLQWSTGTSFELDGKTHATVVQWLESSANEFDFNKPYNFELHYELPFKWDDSFTFEMPDNSLLRSEIELRTMANNALQEFLTENNLSSAIRIWPHHFDTGAFVLLEGTEKSVGMGMAIPDTLLDEHYLYLSGYVGHNGIDTSNFNPLSLGQWKNEGFKGAVLPVSDISQNHAVQFLNEALSQYKK